MTTTRTRTCLLCGQTKPETEFARWEVPSQQRSGYRNHCLTCYTTRSRGIRGENVPAITAELSYGVEIETVGITREACARAMHTVIGGRVEHRPHEPHSPWCVVAPDGRVWRAMTDGSLSDASGHSAEVVTPVLTEADMATLQDVVRAVRRAGARVNHTCGVHVHVGVRNHRGETALRPVHLAGLVHLVHAAEPAVREALQIGANRANYCRALPTSLVNRMPKRPRNEAAVGTAWYNGPAPRGYHYHDSRYHGLNLHAVWDKGTVEFRWFNGTTHAGKIKSYVQLCLGLVRASAKPTPPRFDATQAGMTSLLAHLGLDTAPEFATARHHLLGRWVEGDDQGVN